MADRVTLDIATLDRYVHETAADNIFGRMVTLRWLIQNGKRGDNTGDRLIEPVEMGEGNADSFEKHDVLPARTSDPIREAKFDHRYYEGDLLLHKVDIRSNRGKERRLNYQKTLADNCMKTVRNKMQTHLITNVVTMETKDLQSLHEFFDPAENIGELSVTTYPTWVPKQQTAATFITGDLGYDAMDKLYMQCTGRSGTPPNTGIMHEDVFLAATKRMRGQVRYQDSEMLKVGFDSFKHRHTNFFWEPDMGLPQVGGVDQYPCYMFNTDSFKLRADPDMDFDRTEEVSPPQQPLHLLSYILWRGALTCKERDSNGRALFTALT